jgi:hypothetical protein
MMQYGMSKFVSERHPVSPDAHHRSFTDGAPTGDRYSDTF